MELSIGYSSCPNDTFIFDALIHRKIDTKGIDFKLHMADVKELNELAFNSYLDITKLSFHAYAYVNEAYVLLNSGSALGNNCGPLLIAKKQFAPSVINSMKVAIPGKFTTANFLLSLAFPHMNQKAAMLFDEIEGSVLNGKSDLGLIIHENRFTYQEKGLVKIMDLGEFWEKKYKLPIPLGGIAIKRSLEAETKNLVNQLIAESIAFAFKNPSSSNEYVKQHAQEMDLNVMQQHIKLYVNHYSEDLGFKGKAAINTLFKVAQEKKIVPSLNNPIFL